MKRLLVCAFVLVALAAAMSVWADDGQQLVRVRTSKHPLLIGGSGLTLEFPSAPDVTRWAMAFKAADSGKAFLEVAGVPGGSVPGGAPSAIAAPQPIPFADWPGALVRVTPGRVAVNAAPNLAGLLIYGELPTGTNLSIVSGGTTVFSGTFSGSLRLYDGAIDPHPVRGLADAMLHYTGYPPSGPAYSLRRDGTLVVSLGTLLSHAMAVSLPQAAPDTTGCTNCSRRAFFRVVLGRDGRVARVFDLSGDASLLASGRSALAGWKFRPFVHGSESVPAECTVLLLADSKGRVRFPDSY